MANKPMKTVPFYYQRFKEAVKLRNMTIKEFCNPDGHTGKVIERDEKTIRRWKARGTIPPDILDKMGKLLDVDPGYISGEYDRQFDRITDADTRAILKSQLRPDKYPYLKKQQSASRSGQDLFNVYLESLLAIHHISMRQFQEMPFDKQKAFSLDLERAIVPVLQKHYAIDAMGRKGLRESWYLEAMIDSYDPDEPSE